MTRRRLPDRRGSENFDLVCAGLQYTATVSRFADSGLAEIFISNHKAGSAADTAARDSAIVCSIALQFGADVDTIRKGLSRDACGNANGPLGVALDILAGQPPSAEAISVPAPTTGPPGTAAASIEHAPELAQ